MKLFLRCFGCKKKQKISKTNKNFNNSGAKFFSFITPESLVNKKNNPIKFQEEIDKKTQNCDEQKNNNNENNKNILISEENKEENNKKEKESLITDLSEKDNIKYSNLGLNLNKDIDYDEPLLKADSPLLCDFEKNIKFTKNGLIDLFNKFWALNNYKKVWDKENLIIDIRSEGTEINNECNLIKISFKQLKTDFKENCDIEILVDFMYNPNIRIKWDKILKSLDILEGECKRNYIISTWAKSPVFFMSERESLEKRFIYKSPDENAIYIMSSSIPDDLFPLKKDVVRITNYCNYYKIKDEGDYIGFYSINQTDFKMPIPQFLINVTLPTTTKNWQFDLSKFANEVKYDKVTSTIINSKEEKENK